MGLFVTVPSVQAQNHQTLSRPDNRNSRNSNSNLDDQQDGNRRESQWGRDTTKTKDRQIPIGQFQWTIDRRFGNITPAVNRDTLVHNYQSFNNTDGYNGEYSMLGNLGSPRLSRIYLHRQEQLDAEPFMVLRPYSFFRDNIQDFQFTNTLSPITNLSYHSCGTKQNGEDRVRANFASNINKESGLGFKLDYLYGRGYYNSSATSQFGATVFGYHHGERYNIHAWINANHAKTAENGGIEDDRYIRDPQSFPQKFGSADIPTTLIDTWNRNDDQTYHLTHRYNLGFERDIVIPDSLKPKMPADSELLLDVSDSVRLIARADSTYMTVLIDSLRQNWQSRQITPREFIPVSSIIHTLQIRHLRHTFYANNASSKYYTNLYYGNLSNIEDKANAFQVRNTLGLAMREGFNKWVPMGLTLFATHDFTQHRLPQVITPDSIVLGNYGENNISVGGELSKTQGKLLHYNALAEFTLLGENIGDVNVDGRLDLNFPVSRRDTMTLEAHAFIKNENPNFFYRHHHSQFAWWDNTDLKHEQKYRVEGSLRLPRTHTSLTVGFENVTNYTYFGMQNTLTGTDATSVLAADYSHDVAVRQHSGSLQVFSATLRQDFNAGVLHWENEVTYQKSSAQDILPLPQVNVYSNLYLLFRIAKVLRVQMGGDVRYFTSYYAPDYSPAISQFAVQDANQPRIKIGNYPILNAYVNLHLKHCRIYVSCNHVNAGTGHMFLAPHYPINPMTIHFGLSWNFFN